MEGESPFGFLPVLVAAGMFAGSVLAAGLKFMLPLWPLALGAIALFLLGMIVTALNPYVRYLFLAGASVLAGAAAATAAWLR